jgi:hypothetical protein
MEAGVYFSLNKSAVTVWNALEAECSLQQLAELVSHNFKVTPEQAGHDLETLLAKMIELKLVLSSGETV